MKPYYSENGIEIYHGNCRDFDWAAFSPQPTTLICDPPYEEDWSTLLALSVQNVRCAAIFGYPEKLVRLCAEMKEFPLEWITWWAPNKLVRSRYLVRESEHIAIFRDVPGAARVRSPRSPAPLWAKIARKRGLDPMTRKAGDVWKIASPFIGPSGNGRRFHINEKPIELLKRLVTLCSYSAMTGQLIIDPSCGSGTTLVAAKSQGIAAIGIEIKEEHCEIAAKRLSQEVFNFG